MANNEGTPLGQGYEEIIRDDSLDNTNQQLNRHVYSHSGRIDHEITDFILKRADYTNTFIAIDIAGLPNNATLYLVDENSNQLYSPVDTNGNWVTTRCSITVGENNIIPLPAQFDAQLSSHIPFSAGIYNWKLKFSGNDYYEEKELPLNVEIRDFKVWDILTPQIYPNEDIQVKIKTYADTYYPFPNGTIEIDNRNLSISEYFNQGIGVLTTYATYDNSTGIITYPNQDITDLSIGKHTQVINQNSNCFIDYEVKTPFYISIEGNTLLYKNNGDYDFELKCHQSNSNVTNYPTIYINNTQITQFSGNILSPYPSQGRGYKIQCDNFPPGTYQIEMTGQYDNTDYYTAFNEFEITTEQCTLSLTLEGDIIKTTYLYDNTTPIPNARIGLIDAHTNTLLETAVSDAQGQCIWATTESDIYKSVAYDMRTNEIILESNYLVINSLTSLVLEADKSILSYYDNDKCVLTATLYDNDNTPMEDLVVVFKTGNIVLATITTDSSGVAEYVYNSQGVGDVTITAECMNLQETYTLEDCIYYSESETVSTSDNKYITIADLSSMTLPSIFELSMDYKSNVEGRCGLFNKSTFTNNPNYSVFIGSPNGSWWYYGYRTTSTYSTDIYKSPTDYHTYTISRNGNTFTYKRDDSSAYTKSITWFDSYQYIIGIMMWGTSKTSSVKNIKLKAL